jgi:hypothetical protein
MRLGASVDVAGQACPAAWVDSASGLKPFQRLHFQLSVSFPLWVTLPPQQMALKNFHFFDQ